MEVPPRMKVKIAADHVRLKRAYEPPDRTGVSKEKAAVDLWLKDLAPSTGLRKWFGHDPGRWPEFRERYAAEVRQHEEAYGRLRELALQGTVTLVYSAHDEIHNDAVVLRSLLLGLRA